MSKDVTLQQISKQLPQYLIDIKDFQLGKQIGFGSSGTVFQAYDKHTKQAVAVKILKAQELNEEMLKTYLREVQVLSVCDNPFLLPFVGFTDSYPFTIITPFLERGSLYGYLHEKRKYGELTPTQKTIVAMGIAHGMARLHELHIIHRDLKSLNILLDSNFYPKVCDFGIARYLDSPIANIVTPYAGTPHWEAPEVINSDNYTNKCDVYSYAIILYELLTETIPYQNMKPYDIFKLVLAGKRPTLPSKGNTSIINLIKLCWSPDPSRRPTFLQIYKLFESKNVMFSGTERSAIDQLAEYAKNNSGKNYVMPPSHSPLNTSTQAEKPNIPISHDPSIEDSIFESNHGGSISPQTIQDISNVDIDNAPGFFESLIPHLKNESDPSTQIFLYDLILQVLEKGKDYVKIFLEKNVLIFLRYDIDDICTQTALKILLHCVRYSAEFQISISIFSKIFEGKIDQCVSVLLKICQLCLNNYSGTPDEIKLVSIINQFAPKLIITDGASYLLRLYDYILHENQKIIIHDKQVSHHDSNHQILSSDIAISMIRIAIIILKKGADPSLLDAAYLLGINHPELMKGQMENSEIRQIMKRDLKDQLMVRDCLEFALSFHFTPCDNEIISLLIQVAPLHSNAYYLLCRIASTEQGAQLIIANDHDLSFLKPENCGSELGWTFLLLILKYPSVRNELSMNQKVYEFLNARILANDQAVTTFVPTLLRRFPAKEFVVQLAENTNLLGNIYIHCLNSENNQQISSALTLIPHFAKIQTNTIPFYLSSEFEEIRDMIFQTLKDLIGKNKLIDYVLSALAAISSYAEGAKIIQEDGIVNFLETNNEFVQNIIHNCEKAGFSIQ